MLALVRRRPESVDRSTKGFRGDIQGMRALAVLGILLFHAGLAPYSGGFVTLDVFFVLSGFLITTLLLREVARTGTIDLLAFYTRRARRILPAATVTIAGTVLASWLWLDLVDARDAAVDGVWAALFGANIRFAVENTDYFTHTDPPSPLQHFWSLSVEEQFYLAMPALLLVAVLVAARLLRRHGPRAQVGAIAVALAAVTAGSLAWSVHASAVSPDSAYFSTFTRTWEFAAGALLAVSARPLTRWLTRARRNAVALAGLALIGLAMAWVTETDPYPGWRALLPVVGTAAVLVAGTGLPDDQRPPALQRLLGLAPLRAIGDASYSLYLWHWPVLTIASEHAGRRLRPAELAVALAVTAVLTWLSYRFVETPFRRRSKAARKPVGLVLYPLAVSVAVASCIASVEVIDRQLDTGNPGISVADYTRGPDGRTLSKDPAIALVQASTRAAMDGRKIPGRLRPSLVDLKKDRADLGACEYDGSPTRLCPRGDVHADRTLVVLGNSHGRHWVPALDRIAAKAGWKAYYLVKSRCTSARVNLVQAGHHSAWKACHDFNRWTTHQVERLHPDLVIVSTSGAPAVMVDGHLVNDADGVVREMRAGFGRLFDEMEPLSERVVLLADAPRPAISPGRCLSRKGATLRTCLSRTAPRATDVTRVSKEAARDAGVEIVRTHQWFCAYGRCPAVIGRYIPMRDGGHITTPYARSLAGPLGRALGLLPKG